MEKLTIEQKAKRYDEAIEKAKEHYNKGRFPEFANYIASDIFPELKKKTDKEMIQKLITVVHLYYGEGIDVERDECLEWLEKQSNKNSNDKKINSELFEQMLTIPDGCVATIENNRIHIKREGKSAIEAIIDEKVDNANKVEPKFKVGDWIIFNDDGYICRIISIRNNKYHIYSIYNNIKQWIKITDIDNKCHLWTLSDAKDGDILASPDSKAFIYNGNFDTGNVGAYCGLNIYDEFTIADNKCNWCCNCNIIPATKKQRIALFDEMNSLNYVWNPETKELNRLNKDEENNN